MKTIEEAGGSVPLAVRNTPQVTRKRPRRRLFPLC